MADIGHNSGGIAGDKLRSYIERIERLTEEKAALAADIRDVFAEAKAGGFDVKTMRFVLKLRAMDKDDRDEMFTVVQLYARALGMELME